MTPTSRLAFGTAGRSRIAPRTRWAFHTFAHKEYFFQTTTQCPNMFTKLVGVGCALKTSFGPGTGCIWSWCVSSMRASGAPTRVCSAHLEAKGALQEVCRNVDSWLEAIAIRLEAMPSWSLHNTLIQLHLRQVTIKSSQKHSTDKSHWQAVLQSDAIGAVVDVNTLHCRL